MVFCSGRGGLVLCGRMRLSGITVEGVYSLAVRERGALREGRNLSAPCRGGFWVRFGCMMWLSVLAVFSLSSDKTAHDGQYCTARSLFSRKGRNRSNVPFIINAAFRRCNRRNLSGLHLLAGRPFTKGGAFFGNTGYHCFHLACAGGDTTAHSQRKIHDLFHDALLGQLAHHTV